MTSAFSLPENLKPVQFLTNRVGAGACTGDYVSLKNAHKAWIVIDFTEGGAESVSFQPLKATAVAPTNSTAITSVVKIWSNLATAVSDTLVERTAAVLYATDAAAAAKQIIFEIDPADLGDLAGVPYDVISLTATAPNAADYICGTIWIQPRYASAVATQPTALTD
jgi:hypothetical protein